MRLDKALFPNGCIAVLGMFDGVHLGHQALLRRAAELKKTMSLPVVMVTFCVHPKSLTQTAPPPLTTASQRETLGRAFGADEIVLLPFDETMRRCPARQFVSGILIGRLHAAAVIVGENYRFGYRHSGTPSLLKEYADAFRTEVLPFVRVDGVIVSSTEIRRLLSEGETERAIRFLGHPYQVTGTVCHGRELGRTIGFPTANLMTETLPLRRGVYCAEVTVNGRRYRSVCNYGCLPTVLSEGTPHTECHLLDCRENLYGKEMAVSFLHFLRDEQKFASLEELQHQLEQDRLSAERYFSVTVL